MKNDIFLLRLANKKQRSFQGAVLQCRVFRVLYVCQTQGVFGNHQFFIRRYNIDFNLGIRS